MLKRFLIAAGVVLLTVPVWSQVFRNPNDPTLQTQAPTVTFTVPTSGATYDAGTAATLTVSGTATAPTGVTICTWANSLGGSGTATTAATGSWSVSSVSLTVGSNVLTVTCQNSQNIAGAGVLTVTRSAGGLTCTGATITATQSAIQTRINAATSGDVLCVAAGSFSGAVNIPTGKNIILKGNGIGSTNMTSGSVVFNQSAARVTGFSFTNVDISMNGNDWRLDHNSITNNPFVGNLERVSMLCATAAQPNGDQCRGLVDHNQISGGARVVSDGMQDTPTVHKSWSLPSRIGTAAMGFFVEDNTFTNPDLNTGGNNTGTTDAIDTSTGGRVVFRFNTMNNTAFEIHSLQRARGTRAWELYRNTVASDTGSGGGGSNRVGLIRGGAGVMWGNTITGTHWSDDGIEYDNVRSNGDGGYWYGTTYPPGNSTADAPYVSGSGSSTYPARDQIGMGPDISLAAPSCGESCANVTTATGWPALTARDPAYIFLNYHTPAATVMPWTANGPNQVAPGGWPVVVNRDFYIEGTNNGVRSGTKAAMTAASCTTNQAWWVTDEGSWNTTLPANTSGQLYKCTATNTWTLFYTPYTYPHPANQ